MAMHASNITTTNHELIPLFYGHPVALMFKERDHVLLLTPGSLFRGQSETVIIIAGIGAKCYVVDLHNLTLTPFIDAGLAAAPAALLMAELEKVYHNEQRNIIEVEVEPRPKRSRSYQKRTGQKQAQSSNT